MTNCRQSLHSVHKGETNPHAVVISVDSGGNRRPKQIRYSHVASHPADAPLALLLTKALEPGVRLLTLSTMWLQGTAWRYCKTTVNAGKSYFLIPWTSTLRLSSNFPQMELR